MAVKAEDVAARLLAEFPQALRSGQLVTYFQPELELSTGRVVAAESLARWEHPELGTLSPVLFTSLASKLGLMRELTQLILQLSLRQQRSWARAGWDIPVSVNIGPESVADPQFPAVLADFLRREQVPGPKLTLEVSEQTRTVAVSSSFFAQLAEFGVRVALDDFGTGFASLESLGDWPVNELKLDMSLVRPMAGNASFRTIVRTSIDLAHQLGVKVVAEGVESEAVRSELNVLGCDIGQGFLLGKPMSATVFVDWLRDRDRLALPRGVVATHQTGPPAPTRQSACKGRTRLSVEYSRLEWSARRLVNRVGAPVLIMAAVMGVAYGLWQVFR
jgi:EAL domain-containing protein (putative c-di-GMP-specific phosphodiesterase class I)